jgi:hypothetical protein
VALTRRQIANIAADAVNLRTELMDLDIPMPAANEWVKGAMLGIIMHEIEEDEEDQQQRQARESHGVYVDRDNVGRRPAD